MSAKDCHQSWLSAARTAMEIEAEAISLASGRLNQDFCRAVELILGSAGKLVVIGIGKSGHVGRKIVATLRSTGTRAVFLHAAEAVHGDLGVYAPGDLTLIVSKSGTTIELLNLVPKLRELSSCVIGILGNPDSPLARGVDAVLDASVRREADPHNLAPTASAVVALALGHALAIALMEARGFTADDFHRFHPGGQLGRYLLRVQDVMHGENEVAWASPDNPLKQVVIAMTRWPLGSA
jgi:arabinose-5-phosphate isomerase